MARGQIQLYADTPSLEALATVRPEQQRDSGGHCRAAVCAGSQLKPVVDRDIANAASERIVIEHERVRQLMPQARRRPLLRERCGPLSVRTERAENILENPRLLVVRLLDQKRVVDDLERARRRCGRRGLLCARHGGPGHREPDDDHLDAAHACLPASAAQNPPDDEATRRQRAVDDRASDIALSGDLTTTGRFARYAPMVSRLRDSIATPAGK